MTALGQSQTDTRFSAPRPAILRSVDEVNEQERKEATAKPAPLDSGSIEAHVELHRQIISSNEKHINNLQREQSIRNAELQDELARLAQEVSERNARLAREDAAREQEIGALILENRQVRTEEIARYSRLVAASHAALDALEQEPVLDMRHLMRPDAIVMKHSDIRA